MATVVSTPDSFVSGLRLVEYTFNMPSIGIEPEKKYFIYMLKVDNQNVYSEYKVYNPVEAGQDIVIDFAKDLRGLIETPAPPLGLPSGAYAATNLIRKVEIEYGERTINTETCEDPVDEIDGTTDAIDVFNGINRVFELEPNETYQIHSKRPRRYVLNRDAEDFLYVSGTLEVTIAFYGSFFISSITHTITQPHPGGVAIVIPIGFNIAPAGTRSIRVNIDQLISGDNPTGEYCRIDFCDDAKDDGDMVDIYIQNHWGGVDTLSVYGSSNVQMNIEKQIIVNKYDGQYPVLTKGQRQSINNISAPTMTLYQTFKHVDTSFTRWLNEMVASNNAWAAIRHESGAKVLVKILIEPGTIQTGGEETELTLPVKFSEVELYPY